MLKWIFREDKVNLALLMEMCPGYLDFYFIHHCSCKRTKCNFYSSIMNSCVAYSTFPEWIFGSFWFYIISSQPIPEDLDFCEQPLKDILAPFSFGVLEHASTRHWDRNYIFVNIADIKDLPSNFNYDQLLDYLLCLWGKTQLERRPSRYAFIHNATFTSLSDKPRVIRFEREENKVTLIEDGKEIWSCSIEEYFQPYLENFLAYEFHMRWTGHSAGVNKLLRNFTPYFGQKVLDFGSGPGSRVRILKKILEKNYSNGEIILLDKSEDALTLCQLANLLNYEKDFEIKRLYGDGCNDKLWNEKLRGINTVVCSYVLHWLDKEEIKEFLHNVSKNLTVGGHLIVISEYPMQISQSPFAKYAYQCKNSTGSDELLSKKTGFSMDEIKELCGNEGLVEKQRQEIQIESLVGDGKHSIFGMVFQKQQ